MPLAGSLGTSYTSTAHTQVTNQSLQEYNVHMSHIDTWDDLKLYSNQFVLFWLSTLESSL